MRACASLSFLEPFSLAASALTPCARRAQELKAAQDTFASAKAAAAPKSKFSFKRAAPAPGASTSSAARPPTARPLAPPAPAPRPSTSSVPSTALTLASHTDAHLTSASLPRTDPSPSPGGALALTALTRCLVDLRDVEPFSALYLTDLSGCVVLLPGGEGARGRAGGGGSALMQGCEGCVIALAVHQVRALSLYLLCARLSSSASTESTFLPPLALARPQFRMHDSTSCAVLLDAGSNPVIERCKGLRFGPYPREPEQVRRALSSPRSVPLSRARELMRPSFPCSSSSLLLHQSTRPDRRPFKCKTSTTRSRRPSGRRPTGALSRRPSTPPSRTLSRAVQVRRSSRGRTCATGLCGCAGRRRRSEGGYRVAKRGMPSSNWVRACRERGGESYSSSSSSIGRTTFGSGNEPARESEREREGD